MAYNSDGYIMIDFTEVDFRRTNQTIDGLYKRCVDVIGTNKFILVINANGRTPLPATCSFTNNQYVIDTCIYMFAISSNDNLFIRRNDVPASDIIDDSSISVDKTWSSNKIDAELDGKADTSALEDYQPLLTAGTNITIDENNVISSTGGAVIDDSVMVNNKVWSSLNTVEMLAPIDTVVGSPATFKTSLALPVVACSTSFTATQEGTGTPSTSNKRNIVGVDDITMTVNGNDVVIDLDGTKFGGYVDVANKLIHITDEYADSIGITPKDYSYGSGSIQFQNMMQHSNMRPRYICNMSTFITSETSDIWCGVNNTTVYWIGILNSLSMTLEEFKTWISNNPLQVVYKLRESDQFDIPIDIPTISTLIGNNSFASDTGAITVSYKALPIDLL